MKRLTLVLLAVFFSIGLTSAWAVTPIALYTFGEGQGDTAHDSSGSGDPMDLKVLEGASLNWIAGGGISIEQETVLGTEGAATKLISACKASGEITIAVWIRPASTDLSGPARAVTCSVDPSNRNFTVGVDGADYQMRVRNSGANDFNGMPFLTASGTVDTSKVSKLVYSRDGSGLGTLYIDGEEAGTVQGSGDFSNWNDNYQFGIGREFTNSAGTRIFLGDIHLVAVYDQVVTPDQVTAVEPQAKVATTWAQMKSQ